MDHLPQGSSYWSCERCNPTGFLSYQIDNWHTCWNVALIGTNWKTVHLLRIRGPLFTLGMSRSTTGELQCSNAKHTTNTHTHTHTHTKEKIFLLNILINNVGRWLIKLFLNVCQFYINYKLTLSEKLLNNFSLLTSQKVFLKAKKILAKP